MGRPKKDISKKSFESLCEIQCTLSEIAAFFNCSEDTIERWCVTEYSMSFADIFAIKRGKGKISLRRKQWKLADTSAPMAIWLGKQYLGQKDDPGVNAPQQALPPVNIIIADCEAKDADS